ncbi:MAG: hypothetical protein CMG64_07160 [Candidatus Marinimicrobia bacterium]|nr:hypothetical protein [Candidatus Neomarinimicrobiota bacterium]|tara:strand:- start:7184 stop:9448 length:2265 start_codon:yes stop_codon:yes gene_type:complete
MSLNTKCNFFYLILFFLLLSFKNSNAEIHKHFGTVKNFCGLTFTESQSINIKNIKTLKINIDNNKKWIKNSLNIIRLKKNSIPEKFKKNFSGNIELITNGNIKCKFKSKIRQHGDWKDHIGFKDGRFKQSLDVQLIIGNILGITNFKLFLPETRNYENEIIFTNILNQIGYLAPRTYLVQVDFMGKKHQMLLQEKIRKEFLEFNKLREGPILEGDENLFWSNSNEISSQNNNNLRLSRLENSNWITNLNTSKIASDALTKLNYVYFKYLSSIDEYYNSSKILNLDNDLLSDGNKKHKLFLDVFDILMLSADGYHGLIEHNRKFYYNPINNFFYPIYYDGGINLDINNIYGNLSLQNNLAFEEAKKKLLEININKLTNKIKESNLNLNNDSVSKYLKDLITKIDKLKERTKYKDNKFDNNFTSYYNKKDNRKILIAYYNSNIRNINICENDLSTCQTISINNNILTKLFSQRYKFKDKNVVFLGKINKKKEDIFFDLNLQYNFDKLVNQKKIGNTLILYNKYIDLNYKDNIISIDQITPAGKVLIKNGKLDSLKIIFNGKFNKNLKNIDIYKDKNFITGCLTLYNLELNNIEIYSKNSLCEDAVNLLNVKGKVNYISIVNSNSDALDVDFSSLEMDKIKILLANNDCVDLSEGVYKIKFAKLSKCGDKALSVGEKSNVFVDDLIADSSIIAVASKDYSILNINNITSNKNKFCVLAYRKKQEFIGSYVEINNANCRNSLSASEEGSSIKIKYNDF